MEERYSGMSIEELKAELVDIEGAINNEKIWMLGSSGDDLAMHKANMMSLMCEYEYVMELIYANEDMGR